MKKVSAGQNPHVVSMVGCVTVQEPLSLITEFVPYGNLLQYLRTNQRLVSCSVITSQSNLIFIYILNLHLNVVAFTNTLKSAGNTQYIVGCYIQLHVSAFL